MGEHCGEAEERNMSSLLFLLLLPCVCIGISFFSFEFPVGCPLGLALGLALALAPETGFPLASVNTLVIVEMAVAHDDDDTDPS